MDKRLFLTPQQSAIAEVFDTLVVAMNAAGIGFIHCGDEIYLYNKIEVENVADAELADEIPADENCEYAITTVGSLRPTDVLLDYYGVVFDTDSVAFEMKKEK